MNSKQQEVGTEPKEVTEAKAKQPDPKEIRTLDELTPAQQAAHRELVTKNPVSNLASNKAKLATPETEGARAAKHQKNLVKAIGQNLMAPDPKADLDIKKDLLESRSEKGKKAAKKAAAKE